MHSMEEKRKAIETLIKFDHSYADTIAELDYPNRHTLNNWWREQEEYGELRPSKYAREPKYDHGMRQAAVDYYLEHGKSKQLEFGVSQFSPNLPNSLLGI